MHNLGLPTAVHLSLSRSRSTLSLNRLVGLVVKASASRAAVPGFDSRSSRDFSGSSHTTDCNTGNPVAILPGAWRYRVGADWLARCQYTVTGWGRKLDLQLLSQNGSTSNCLSRSVSEVY